jgi:hypothetical protein
MTTTANVHEADFSKPQRVLGGEEVIIALASQLPLTRCLCQRHTAFQAMTPTSDHHVLILMNRCQSLNIYESPAGYAQEHEHP